MAEASGEGLRLGAAEEATLVAVSPSSVSLVDAARTWGLPLSVPRGFSVRFPFLSEQSRARCPFCLQMKHFPSFINLVHSSLLILEPEVCIVSTSIASGSRAFFVGLGSLFLAALSLRLMFPFALGPVTFLSADHCSTLLVTAIQSSSVWGRISLSSTLLYSQAGRPCLNMFRVPWVSLSQWARLRSSSNSST